VRAWRPTAPCHRHRRQRPPAAAPLLSLTMPPPPLPTPPLVPLPVPRAQPLLVSLSPVPVLALASPFNGNLPVSVPPAIPPPPLLLHYCSYLPANLFSADVSFVRLCAPVKLRSRRRIGLRAGSVCCRRCRCYRSGSCMCVHVVSCHLTTYRYRLQLGVCDVGLVASLLTRFGFNLCCYRHVARVRCNLRPPPRFNVPQHRGKATPPQRCPSAYHARPHAQCHCSSGAGEKGG